MEELTNNTEGMSRIMNAEKPELQDFGIKPGEYLLYAEKHFDFFSPIVFTSLGLVWVFVLFIRNPLTIFSGAAFLEILFGILFGIVIPALLFAVGVIALITTAIDRYKRSRLLESPTATQIKLYEEALSAYQSNQEKAKMAQREAERAQREAERIRREAEKARHEAELARKRKQADYWMNLSGGQFEREMATLFTRRGYQVELRGGTGDGGIDILARKGGKTTIIQCKRYQKPAGPAAARELYGSLIAFGADYGMLVCTAGFTKGVRDFVEGLKGKPIRLVDSWDIIKVAEATDGRRNELPAPNDRTLVGGAGGGVDRLEGKSMTDDELIKTLEAAKEGIPCEMGVWDFGPPPPAILYCKQKGLVRWEPVQFGVRIGIVKLTEVGTRELARLRSL